MATVTVRYVGRPEACFKNPDEYAFEDHFLRLLWYHEQEGRSCQVKKLKREVLISYRHVLDMDVCHG